MDTPINVNKGKLSSGLGLRSTGSALNGQGSVAFLNTLVSRSFVPTNANSSGTIKKPGQSPMNGNGFRVQPGFQPSSNNRASMSMASSPQISNGRGMGTSCLVQSPERMSMQMNYIEKKCDDVLDKIVERNSHLLSAMNNLQDTFTKEIFDLRTEFKQKFDEIVRLVSDVKIQSATLSVPQIQAQSHQIKKEEKSPTIPQIVANPIPKKEEKKPLSELFKKAEGSWDCSSCYVNNNSNVVKCISCQTMKPGCTEETPEKTTSSKPSFGNAFANFSFSSTGTSFGDLANATTTFAKPVDFKGFGGEGKPLFGNFAALSASQAKDSPSPKMETTNKDPPQTQRQRNASEGEGEDDFVPTAEFTPVIPLPPLVEVKLGDENETVIFEHRAKIYRFDSSVKEWKERGVGNIKILQDKEDKNSVRIVMWREKIGKLACNHRVTGDMAMEFYQGNPKVLKWTAIDHAEGEPRPEIFTCRFGHEDKCAEFKQKFEEVVKLMSDVKIQSPTLSAPQIQSQVSQKLQKEEKPLSELFKKAEGSWDCGSCYVNNKSDALKCLACQTLKPGYTETSETKTSPKPSFGNAFTNFSFSSTGTSFGDLANATATFAKPVDFQGFGGEGKPLFGNFASLSASQAKMETTNKDPPQTQRQRNASEGEGEDDFVPTAEFTPVIPLPPLVEVKLGDENETVIFEHRAKIYRFDSSVKEWKERGVGNIKILQDKEDKNSVRIVMWREKIGKLACNHRVTGDMVMEFYQGNPKVLKWTAIDHAEGEPRPEIFTCRFGHEDKCAEFKQKFEEVVKLMSDVKIQSPTLSVPQIQSQVSQKLQKEEKPLSELFKKAEGSWDCTVCYLNNKSDTLKCLACQTMKPGFTETPDEKTTSSKPSFGNAFANFSFSFTGSSFGDLANTTTTFAKPVDFKGFGGEGKPLFGNFAALSSSPLKIETSNKDAPPRQRNASEGEGEDDFVPTAEFAPVIPLPPLVEVKLGDENETVIFEHRAKIYRFDSSVKEWKERGVGNIKILQDKEDKNSVRIVMWREKIGKLACNHRVTGDMAMEFYQGNPKVLKWTAIDHAEGEPRPEIFTCRFGHEDKCAEFKQKFEEVVKLMSDVKIQSPTLSAPQIQAQVSQKEEKSPIPSIVANQIPKKEEKPLSELFKKAEGSWDCSSCYVNNKSDTLKCLACQTMKPGCTDAEANVPTQPQSIPIFTFGFGTKSINVDSQLKAPESFPEAWADFDEIRFN